jgi:hypothetical protein
LKVTTHEDGDTSRLGAAYVLPYRATRNYVTEEKATSLIEDQPRWMSVNALGYFVRPYPDTLRPGTSSTYSLSPNAPIDSAGASGLRNHLSQ